MSLALEQQRLAGQPQDPNPKPEPLPGALILAPALGRFWRLFRLSIWRAFEHDAFGTAKASAYSAIFTFFPALLVLGSALAALSRGQVYLREISYALGTILPAGSSAALSYLQRQHGPVGWPALHHFVIDGLERLRRHHLLDGWLSPRLPASQDLGTAQRARDCDLAGLDGRFTADLRHHSGCLRQPH